MIGRVLSVQVGAIAPFGPDGVPSAYRKSPIAGPVVVGPLGLDGDEQADPRYHGGIDKAVYGYAASHYAAWCNEHPHHADKLAPGAFGENLTIDGLIEADICLGDIHQIGSAFLQVCQPREPCFKLAIHFDDALMPKAMTRSRRSGWYYRVIQPGALQTGDEVILTDRPHPDFALNRLIAIAYQHSNGANDWHALSTMTGAAERWRIFAEEKIASDY